MSQAKWDERKEDGKGDGNNPARVQSSTPKPIAEFTPVWSKTFYRSKKTPSERENNAPLTKRSLIQETLIAMEDWAESNQHLGEKNHPNAPVPEEEIEAGTGFPFVGPLTRENSSGDYELYDEQTVELSDSNGH